MFDGNLNYYNKVYSDKKNVGMDMSYLRACFGFFAPKKENRNGTTQTSTQCNAQQEQVEHVQYKK